VAFAPAPGEARARAGRCRSNPAWRLWPRARDFLVQPSQGAARRSRFSRVPLSSVAARTPFGAACHAAPGAGARRSSARSRRSRTSLRSSAKSWSGKSLMLDDGFFDEGQFVRAEQLPFMLEAASHGQVLLPYHSIIQEKTKQLLDLSYFRNLSSESFVSHHTAPRPVWCFPELCMDVENAENAAVALAPERYSLRSVI